MISPRLRQLFRTRSGNKIFGVLSNPATNTDKPVERGRRYFRTERTPLVKSGDVIQGGGSRFLLVHHASDLFEVRFLALEIRADLNWTRLQKVINPVTRMEEGSEQVLIEKALPVAVEPAGVFEEQRFDRIKYQIFAPGLIKEGDKLGEYTVHTVQHIDGELGEVLNENSLTFNSDPMVMDGEPMNASLPEETLQGGVSVIGAF